jgi:surface antigen
MKKIATLFGIALLALTMPGVMAQNINFLSRGPVAHMDDTDKAILRQAISDALNNHADGERVEWVNPDTDHGGTIMLLDTHEDYGTICRSIRTRSRAAGRSGGGNYRLCKADDDTWQFAPNRRQSNPDK